ncbi:MAG: ABC transporter permease [Caldilineaceae bacterium]
MVANQIELLQAKDLLWEWTARNIRARYQQSALGWLWAILQPAAQAAIFTVVFTMIVKIQTGEIPYVLFAYIAIVPWTLTAAALPDMANALVDNMALVTKIYFPREVLPVAALLARLLDFGVAAILIVLLLLFYQVPLALSSWLYLPAILALQVLLLLGLGLISAALNVFFRDVRSLLVLGLQLWFYASPIIYPVTMVPAWLRPFYFLNPMAGIIAAYRDILLAGTTPGAYLLPSALISIGLFGFGYWFFKRVEFEFADIV